MSTVSSISSSYPATSALPATPTATVAPKSLGQDDFLKLLAQQFQSQDPLKPMEDTSFIAQMAQFTSLQQSSSMAKDMAAMRTDQQLATANSYLGHNVTVDSGNGQTMSGSVTGVEMADGTPRLVIGNYTFPLSAVLLVEPGAINSSNPTPTTGQ